MSDDPRVAVVTARWEEADSTEKRDAFERAVLALLHRIDMRLEVLERRGRDRNPVPIAFVDMPRSSDLGHG